jgi:hypothetical protein
MSNSQSSYSSTLKDEKLYGGFEKLNVGDKPALQSKTVSENILFIDTTVFLGDMTFRISYEGENKPEFVSLYNQILSTFKFYNKQAATSSTQLIDDVLKKVEVEGKVMQSTKFTLPKTLADANWGLKQIICQEGGYDLTPYAGKTIDAYYYPIREKYNGIEPLSLWILNDGQKVICAYKAVRSGSQLTPGIFPMK